MQAIPGAAALPHLCTCGGLRRRDAPHLYFVGLLFYPMGDSIVPRGAPMPTQAIHSSARSTIRQMFCRAGREERLPRKQRSARQSLDGWAPQGSKAAFSSQAQPGSTLQKLVVPKALRMPLDDEAVLRDVVSRLNQPGFFVQDLEGIERVLSALIQKRPARHTAYLWRGIAKRIGGKDGRDDLRVVLKRHPGHRLAALNLAATSLTCSAAWLEDLNCAEALGHIQHILIANDRDRFAQLLAILIHKQMTGDMPRTIHRLEQFYLANPDYAGAIACLAASFWLVGNMHACLDFAQEAQRKDRHSLLAYNLLARDIHDKWVGEPLAAPYARIRGDALMGYNGFLSGPYASSDIEFDVRESSLGE
jgi:hypothetical protein